MIYRIIWCIFSPLILIIYGWLCFKFTYPLISSNDGLVLYEPIGFMLGILYSGFFALLIIFSHRLLEVVFLKSIEFPKVAVRNMFAFGFVFGFLVNHGNYYLVIKPNEYIECPVEIGYKKNLMYKYVSDIKFCD